MLHVKTLVINLANCQIKFHDTNFSTIQYNELEGMLLLRQTVISPNIFNVAMPLVESTLMVVSHVAKQMPTLRLPRVFYT